MTKFIVGAGSSNDVFMALYEAGVFVDDPRFVRRVVIDLTVGSAARVFVERFLDSSFVEVVLSGGVEIVERERAAVLRLRLP